MTPQFTKSRYLIVNLYFANLTLFLRIGRDDSSVYEVAHCRLRDVERNIQTSPAIYFIFGTFPEGDDHCSREARTPNPR